MIISHKSLQIIKTFDFNGQGLLFSNFSDGFYVNMRGKYTKFQLKNFDGKYIQYNKQHNGGKYDFIRYEALDHQIIDKLAKRVIRTLTKKQNIRYIRKLIFFGQSNHLYNPENNKTMVHFTDLP